MLESLKGKLTEEEAREILRYAEPIKSYYILNLDIDLTISDLRQAGIIHKSAKEEYIELFNRMPQTTDLITLYNYGLQAISEAENKNKEK